MGLMSNSFVLFLVFLVFRQNCVEGAAAGWSAATGTTSIDENSASGAAVTVTQTPTNTPTTVTIESATPAAGSTLFAVALNNAKDALLLTVAGSLDREAQAQYVLVIRESMTGFTLDSAVPDRNVHPVIRAENGDGHGDLTLTVAVDDKNDVAPSSVSDVFTAIVPKDTPASTDLMTIAMTDGDATSPNKDITYALTAASTTFAIDGSTGVFSNLLKLETVGANKVLVKATDGGTPALTTTVTACVCVGSIKCLIPDCTESGSPEIRATLLTSAVIVLLAKIL